MKQSLSPLTQKTAQMIIFGVGGDGAGAGKNIYITDLNISK
ncbi:MAG: hypothetical protein ACI8WB_003510 [Phenylobacterium sp.]|jgi:hypothetical protein